MKTAFADDGDSGERPVVLVRLEAGEYVMTMREMAEMTRRALG